MAAYPIPTEALDDRLAWTGIPGSGKTYNCGTAVERLLKAKSRVCIVDPLGVWWGLRLRTDGEPSPFKIVIFGGRHGDIAITPTSGRIIGETVAQMAESCIVDLSEFDTEAEQRRFMLAFVMGAYARLTGELLHLVLDEADMWVPQHIRDKDGDPAKLHHHVQKIVRRGRVKGFIPWLITQRPAEISKSVLSMCAGIVAGNLTSPQDVGAMMDWVGKRADPTTAKLIETGLPSFRQGEAAVYIPARRVLEIGRFPAKATFDSSKAPERGESRSTIALKPLDLGALRTRLAKVEAETLANDPAALKKRIVDLERAARAPAPGASAADVAAARQAGDVAGYQRGLVDGESRGLERGAKAGWRAATVCFHRGFTQILAAGGEPSDHVDGQQEIAKALGLPGWPSKVVERPRPPPAAEMTLHRPPPRAPAPSTRPNGHANPEGAITPARQKLLDTLAWLSSIGQDAPDKVVVAFLAGVSSKSSGYANNLGALRTAGFIDYPSGGRVALTEDGRALAAAPARRLDHAAMIEAIGEVLAPSLMRVLSAVVETFPTHLSRQDVAARVGLSASSSGFANSLGRLSSLGLVTYPEPGFVRAADLLFPERSP